MNRIITRTFLIVACLGFHASTAASGDIEDRVLFCSSVGDDRQKLACFEAIADSLRERPAEQAPSAPQASQKVDKKQIVKETPPPREEFGKPRRKEKVDEISAVIDEVQYDGRGRAYVRLDSGQVWTQVDSERVVLDAGDRVVIKRGALGAYFMQPEGSNKRIKVRRRD